MLRTCGCFGSPSDCFGQPQFVESRRGRIGSFVDINIVIHLINMQVFAWFVKTLFCGVFAWSNQVFFNPSVRLNHHEACWRSLGGRQPQMSPCRPWRGFARGAEKGLKECGGGEDLANHPRWVEPRRRPWRKGQSTSLVAQSIKDRVTRRPSLSRFDDYIHGRLHLIWPRDSFGENCLCFSWNIAEHLRKLCVLSQLHMRKSLNHTCMYSQFESHFTISDSRNFGNSRQICIVIQIKMLVFAEIRVLVLEVAEFSRKCSFSLASFCASIQWGWCPIRLVGRHSIFNSWHFVIRC